MRRAFTLIELLVVVAILALVLGIVLPTLSHARNSGRQTTCIASLRDIGAAMQAYAHVHRDTLPPSFEAMEYAAPVCQADRRTERYAGNDGSYELQVPEGIPGLYVPPTMATREAYALESEDKGRIANDLSEWHPVTYYDINSRPKDGWMNGAYFDGSARKVEE